jgi:RNA polymerase sigma-70 factor (ECF subfamily)
MDEESYPIEKIMEKMEHLPDGYKMVLKLHLLDELDFVDIAEMMNVKASTVRSQYVRGLEKLRVSLIHNS